MSTNEFHRRLGTPTKCAGRSRLVRPPLDPKVACWQCECGASQYGAEISRRRDGSKMPKASISASFASGVNMSFDGLGNNRRALTMQSARIRVSSILQTKYLQPADEQTSCCPDLVTGNHEERGDDGDNDHSKNLTLVQHRYPANVTSRSLQPGAELLVRVLPWTRNTVMTWFPDGRIQVYCQQAGVRFVEIRANLSKPEERQKALSEADIVLFNYDFPVDRGHLVVPPRVREQTLYVLASMESPREPHYKTIRSKAFLENFNFLWSYNHDLTFHASYFVMYAFHLWQVRRPPAKPFRKKLTSVLLVTMVSNCDNRWGRSSLIKELTKRISVHNYGRCHNNVKWPAELGNDNQGGVRLFSRYKFNFAVENCECKDYMTEKFLRALQVGSIPLVASFNYFPNYTKMTPSVHLPVFINVADFESVDALVTRLLEVANSEQLYSQFMSYRQLTKDKLNPLFQREIDEKAENHFFCRFAKQFSEGRGRLNLARARRHIAHVNETCIMRKYLPGL